MNVDLEVLKEYLPLLLALFVWALVHVLTHKSYKHGNRILWLVVIILMMNFVGPILYFILGKEEA